MIKDIAEKLLGRSLTEKDGVDIATIEKAEDRLGEKLPVILKEFYINVGKLDFFTSSFQLFLLPEDLYFEDGKLVFLEENQVVCFWGINLHEENSLVFQMQNIDKAIWYSEEILLSEFLKMMMYGQCAEGGYEYSGAIYDIDKDELREFTDEITASNWKKVVDHNNWIIFENERKLIWYYTTNDGGLADGYPLFVSTKTKSDLEKMEKEFGFSDLD